MISLEALREYMHRQYEEDRQVRSMRVRGPTVEEALKQASIELGVPVRRLEYEVLQAGSKGLLGAGRREWVLLAYPSADPVMAPGVDDFSLAGLEMEGAGEAPERDRPGEVFLRLTHNGAYLKVTRPTGRGARATEREAIEKLTRRGVRKYDGALVSRLVRQAEGEYIRVGDFDYNPANQATLHVEIYDQEMAAAVTVTPPGPGGADLTPEEITSLLRSHGVVHGFLEEAIRQLADSPRYGEAVVVAEGTRPVNGQNAQIVYNFNTDRSRVQLKEKDGRVDFKDLDLVENVEAGQILARKIPPESGTPGSTITGRLIPAKPGKDIPFNVGKNVNLSEDGMTALAAINGQVLLIAGKINVEPVYTVEGDVNFRTGNVLFLGTVVVKGNVEDGFSVKAAGNIEVMGSVGKCELDAEGDVIVHQGILGKNQGRVTAGLSVYAKFIEHAQVRADVNAIVSDGIIHSNVDANQRILCQGRRAAIVGGRLRAAEEINAKTLGSVAGTETVLEVGFDPRSKERLVELTTSRMELEKQIAETELNIRTINNLRKVQKKIPEEKIQSLRELSEKRADMLARIGQVNEELASINEYLAGLKTKGKVSASDRVYPGVKIFIKNESLLIRNEFRKVTFYLQGKEIQMTKYEPIEGGAGRRP